ncbi:MAG: c-type cytochrome [Burkholderiales bacterium]
MHTAVCRSLVAAATLCAWPAAAQPAYPEFPDPRLKAGRVVWIETCRPCHTADFAGAPKVTDKAAWAPRIRKDRETLYQHALNGFHGPLGTEMPPRGGNARLSDDQVKAAVDYMIALAIRFGASAK